MFNVPTKAVFFSVIALIILTSCDSAEKKEKERRLNAATALVASIDSAISAHAYTEALTMIDTLNERYPEQLNLRQTTLLSKALAMEGLIRDSIPLADAEMVRSQLEIDSLSRFFVKQSEKGLSERLVDKKVQKREANSLFPVVEDANNPWSLIVSAPSEIGIEGIAADVNGTNVYINIPNASSRTVIGKSGESISLSGMEAAPLAEALNGKASSNLSVTIVGNKKDVKINVAPATQDAIYRCYMLAKARERHRRALVQRELLERKLIVAENQVANFTK